MATNTYNNNNNNLSAQFAVRNIDYIASGTDQLLQWGINKSNDSFVDNQTDPLRLKSEYTYAMFEGLLLKFNVAYDKL